MMFRLIPPLCHAVLLGSLIALPVPAGAQLLSQTVNDTSRVCVYVGSDVMPGGEVLPRTVVVGLGQECPTFAPYRDVNAPVPPNAQLTGERTGTDNRTCLYSEGGIEFRVTIDLTLRCAATPALTERARAAAQ